MSLTPADTTSAALPPLAPRQAAKPLGASAPGAGTSAGGAPAAPALGVASVSHLADKLAEYLSPADLKKVKEAYRFSDEMHLGQIIAALRAGKHVFCEKPLSLDLGDCLKVEAEAARHPQLTIMIGFVRRFDASYHDAQQKIAQGLIGKPYLVRSQTCDQHDPSGAFMRFAPTSGGIFLDCSVHDIDLARWLLGNPVPKRVYASGTNAIHTGLQAFGDVDNGLATVEFSDGSMASFMASRTMAHGHETLTEVFGTGGRLAVGSNPRLNRVEISDAHGVRNECTPDFYARFADAFLIEAQEFTDAALGRRSLSLTLHDATEATRIGLAMTQAMREARPVEF